MRKAVLGLAVLLWPLLSEAQETYTINANANQVSDLTTIVGNENGQVCDQLALPLGCTQAQACTAANAPGGASCTAAQARGAGVRIYPQTQAGREEFVTFRVAAPKFQELRAGVPSFSQKKQCDFWATAPRAGATGSRDAMCAAAGLPTSVNAPAGCELCQ